MGLHQRRKGATFERKIRARFEAAGFIDAQRRAPMQASNADDADVRAGPFHIECKHQKRPNAYRALQQAESTCHDGYWPISVCQWHGDQGGAVVSMRLDDFLDLVKEWRERGDIRWPL